MTEPEVSLIVAMHYIQSGETSENVAVSIDGAHIKTKDTVHFDIVAFLRKNGYVKRGNTDKWQDEYKNEKYVPCIIVSSKPGVGDVAIALNNGKTLYVESKKFKSGSGGEYPAMREAIGQLMTGCPDDKTPVVAVPYNKKSVSLAKQWLKNNRMRNAGICFALVHDNGHVEFAGWENND